MGTWRRHNNDSMRGFHSTAVGSSFCFCNQIILPSLVDSLFIFSCQWLLGCSHEDKSRLFWFLWNCFVVLHHHWEMLLKRNFRLDYEQQAMVNNAHKEDHNFIIGRRHKEAPSHMFIYGLIWLSFISLTLQSSLCALGRLQVASCLLLCLPD